MWLHDNTIETGYGEGNKRHTVVRDIYIVKVFNFVFVRVGKQRKFNTVITSAVNLNVFTQPVIG